MSQYLGDISAYALAVSQGYTGTEEEYAELMASYATVGQTAVTAAQTATTKASEAATSATTATNKASEATTAATTATTKAGEASTSASTATSAKDTAVSASQTATTKATEATTAAATATSAKTDAVAANTAAQSAKTAAQTAQTGAETAAASVQSSAAQIATNTEDISQLKSDLTQSIKSLSSDGTVPFFFNFVNGWVDGSGNISHDYTDRWMTDYIPIESGFYAKRDDGYVAYIMYFDANKQYINNIGLSATPKSIQTEISSTTVGYFILQIRKDGMSYSEINALHIYKELFEKEPRLLSQNIAQGYSNDRSYVIEESPSSKKIYFRFPELYLRPSPYINKTYGNFQAFAQEVGEPLVISPNGVSNCIELQQAKCVVFDINDAVAKIIDRQNVTASHIVLLSQVNGRVVYARQDVFPPLRGVASLSKYINSGNINFYSQNLKMIDSVRYNSALKFLFFSDIHGSGSNMNRIVEFANALGSGKLDFIINGGDTVQSVISDGLTWYNNAVDNCDIDVLLCVGNHDEWSNSSTQTEADMSDVYAAEIAPMIQKVNGIVQPSGASDNSLCYYYKDYGDIRIIVLDAMVGHITNQHYNSDQDTWFKGVLSDAISDSKLVICVNHAPYAYTDTNVQEENVGGWNCFKPFNTNGDGVSIAQGALDAVDDFIDDGGTFICWLAGHRHKDFVVNHAQHENQYMFVISTASHTRHTLEGATTSNVENNLYDCFNYMAVDTSNNILKVWRIGYNIDGGLKRKNTLAYNYVSRDIVSYD